MKRNRLISALLTLTVMAMSFVCPVFADDSGTPTAEVSVRAVGQEVEISASLPNGAEGDLVNYMIVSKDVTQEMLDGKQGDLTASIVTLDFGTLKADQTFSARIKLGTKIKTDTYHLVLASASLPEPVIQPFDFVQPQEIKDALSAINSAQASGSDFSAVETALEENSSALGIDLQDYQKDAFAEKRGFVLRQIKSVTYNPEDYTAELIKFQELFGGAMLKGLVETASSASELDSAVTKYKIYVSEDFANYNKAKEKNLLNGVYNYFKGKTFDDTETFFNELNVSAFFAQFNAAGSKKIMKELIEEYDKVYFTLKYPSNLTTMDDLMTYLSKRNNYQSVTDLQDTIDKWKPGTSGNTGNTGTGSGSGSRPGPGPDNLVVSPTSKPTTTPTPSGDIGNVFADLGGFDWAEESISKLYDNKVIAAAADKRYRPQDSVTREEFVKMLVVSLDILDENAVCSFDDVSKDDWFYPYIASAVSKGVVKGVSDTGFGVGENVTRQDVAALIYRAAENLNVTLKQDKPEKDFSDKAAISDYAAAAVGAMSKAGILNGYEDNTFQPHSTATRAEAAVMIAKFAF